MRKAVSWKTADEGVGSCEAGSHQDDWRGSVNNFGRVSHGGSSSREPNAALDGADKLATMQPREPQTKDSRSSFDKVEETVPRRRWREPADIDSLADKLAAIEARLSVRDEMPRRGTLARLEARLEQIGYRTEAECRAPIGSQYGADPLLRLEGKLNAVLEALVSTHATQPAEGVRAASRATSDLRADVAQPGPSSRRQSLGEAVVEIAKRQSALDSAAHETRTLPGARVARRDEFREAVSPQRPTAAPEPSPGNDGLRREIAQMAEQLRGVAPRSAVTAMESRIADLTRRLEATDTGATKAAIGELRAQMETMNGRLLNVQELAAHPPGPNMSLLERLVCDLGARIEAIQAPGAGAQAIDALQQQIGTLATRLESTETEMASLASLDRSMRDLFDQLDETRTYTKTAASRAATEAVRTAIGEMSFDRPAPSDDIDALRAMHEDADTRTRAMLDVFQDALDKVVDRLSVVEDGLIEARVAHARRDEAMLDAPPIPRTPLVPEPETAKPQPRADADAPKSRGASASEASFGQADFIAAARRAAHAAQTDPSIVTMRRPVAPAADEAQATRAGLAAKSREYIASHKRPVLMALAAVVVITATLALMQPLPLGSTGPEVAQAPVPSRVATHRSAVRAPRAPAVAAHILGSDPVATGSVPSLPSLAGRSSSLPPVPKPTLPVGLAAAAEAGDAAAQYTLAAAYAEGQAVLRDFTRAAKLYAKAADQGVVPARYRLGALYERGLGVVQDKARARSLYQQAADAGSPRAMHNLAVLLADGDGKPDYEGAVTWFRRAAQLGVHDSEFNLAVLLARGLGVDRSLLQSYQWFAIAAQHGDADAAAKRDEVGVQLSASELSVAKALAAAFHPREPDPAAVDVIPPQGGWDGATAPVHLNSPRSKIS